MRKISQEKYDKLVNLSTENHIISALAIDQRGSLRKMIEAGGGVDDVQSAVEAFKIAISEELTPFASSILLDPEYGIPASKQRVAGAGLLMAYEETGYDATEPGRLPDLLPEWSAKRIKELGADSVKFLLYYDVDEDEKINDWKHSFTERIGSECEAEGIPFFLEILTYDATDEDNKSAKFAKVKPHKVIAAMKEFSKERYNVDVLKVEVPVNMNYVEGFAKDEVVYTKEEAQAIFREQEDATHLPYIYLSAGVSAKLFQDTLEFAHEAGAKFNGVLCGRATWKDAVPEFASNGEAATREWLRTIGKQNIEELNAVLERTATPWTDLIEVK
ncbi:tagatose-bisphosphate aldolase [Aerococcaceae bacterium zg-ZJ1578]|uniref:tagatose-bisphosphate aldolase n=1 Tax=Aerococcaceae TaxID=186827 RepID=UPI0013B67FC7|nr:MULTISPECIES: tagatose-bisphosphate aldolase [unclassified Facklamia]MBK0347752.1 tagatose-bisphosphate aldolase [Aerococcaceae bacterium zg-1578]NEW64145.1 tagatose-bisphosphate aldolase [Facklamia sp. 252]NEW67602.1 tagatose-bisphosphate aldolase [Facklamia sp. 253]QQD65851.1 tagatose-bisphosphate aldolase [Aerococcaceae bacterium zg-252]